MIRFVSQSSSGWGPVHTSRRSQEAKLHACDDEAVTFHFQVRVPMACECRSTNLRIATSTGMRQFAGRFNRSAGRWRR